MFGKRSSEKTELTRLNIYKLIEEFIAEMEDANAFAALGMEVKDHDRGQDYFKIARAHLSRMPAILDRLSGIDPAGNRVWAKMREVLNASYQMINHACEWSAFVHSPLNNGSRWSLIKLNEYTANNRIMGERGDMLGKQLFELLKSHYDFS